MFVIRERIYAHPVFYCFFPHLVLSNLVSVGWLHLLSEVRNRTDVVCGELSHLVMTKLHPDSQIFQVFIRPNKRGNKITHFHKKQRLRRVVGHDQKKGWETLPTHCHTPHDSYNQQLPFPLTAINRYTFKMGSVLCEVLGHNQKKGAETLPTHCHTPHDSYNQQLPFPHTAIHRYTFIMEIVLCEARNETVYNAD